MSISGLVSNLDTNSIIRQMMELERNPQRLLVQRKSNIQATVDAYSAIRGRLTSLETAANALRRPIDWQARVATTDSDDVTVSATPSASAGSFTFEVTSLAARHSVRSGETISATSDVIANGGSIEITNSSGTHSLAVGGGTLAEVVAAINSSDLGLTAAAVNTGNGFRLQVTARTTGAASSFDVTGGLDAAVGGMVVATSGADATLTIGSGPGAYSVASSSNTFSDIVPGLTITARQLSTAPVTVSVDNDVDGLVERMNALVDAANAVRSEIATRSSFNPETGRAASLAGDAVARRLTQDLNRAVTLAVPGSSLGSGGLAGLSTDRNGRLTFDAARFREAYESDPSAVQALFAQSGSATGDVSFVTGGSRTVEGSYDVVVTQAATAASATGLVGSWPLAESTDVAVRIGSSTVTVTIQPTDSAADAAAALQAAVTGAGLSLTVTEQDGGLRIARNTAGSSASFEVAWDGSTFESHAGTDIQGTIGGVEATGRGSTLTVPIATPGVGGLAVSVTPGVTGAVGTVDYAPGIAQRVANAVNSATDRADGYLTSRTDGQNRRITDLNRSIAAWDTRLEAREARLRQQFSQLEVLLGETSSRSNWLASQISGLSAGGGA